LKGEPKMRIKKISKIKDLGTFKNFQWQDEYCDEFGQYNFFYGWNYSGKTSLSRLFKCLEDKQIHPDYSDLEFELETDNGILKRTDINKSYNIRVFNEDFVEENFQWNQEDAKIDPVLILGKEAKDLENKAKNLRKQKEEKKNELKKLEKEQAQKENKLNSSLTNKASEIRKILNITNSREFDRSALEGKIRNIKDNYQDLILDSNEEQNKLNSYRSKKPSKIEPLIRPILKLSDYINEVENILSTKVSAQKIIEKLKENPRLNKWVREGLDLHKNESLCQFCGNPLPPDLFERLNKHFSKEFDNLINNIDKLDKRISNYIEEIKQVKLPDKARLFEESQSIYEDKLNSLNNIKNSYIHSLELLKEELKRKKEKPFDSLGLNSLTDNTKELENSFEEIKRIINEHNSKVETFEKEKQKVKEELIDHFVALFIKESNYLNEQEEIKKIKEKIEELKSEIKSLDEQIKEIERQIKAEAIGAEKINQYLTQFFNSDRLRIQLIEDGKYKLYRDNQIAKNLSTGEKNIISLIYFFAKLEETHFDFGNAIVFIDDPVSSLDSNHIFKVYGFIQEKLKDCGQVFITTHNFDFFNLLKDLSKYDWRNKGNFYLIKKLKNQNGEYSCIENLPSILLKFKSEYNYLFSILKSFDESNDKAKFEQLYILPNILRRFFEAYLYMKYPDGERFNAKAKKFLEGENFSDIKAALKLMDEYSHEEDPSHVQKFPPIEEVSHAVSFILKTIGKKDKDHYKALCQSLTSGNNASSS